VSIKKSPVKGDFFIFITQGFSFVTNKPVFVAGLHGCWYGYFVNRSCF